MKRILDKKEQQKILEKVKELKEEGVDL